MGGSYEVVLIVSYKFCQNDYDWSEAFEILSLSTYLFLDWIWYTLRLSSVGKRNYDSSLKTWNDLQPSVFDSYWFATNHNYDYDYDFWKWRRTGTWQKSISKRKDTSIKEFKTLQYIMAKETHIWLLLCLQINSYYFLLSTSKCEVAFNMFRKYNYFIY